MGKFLYNISRDDRWYLRLIHFVILLAGCAFMYFALRSGKVLLPELLIGILFIGYWIYLRIPTK
jgi:hypothetical protein